MESFKIRTKSGSYAELLEVYGLANLLQKILDSQNLLDIEIYITKNNDSSYEIKLSNPISDEIIDNLTYFHLFKYIKQKTDSDVSGYSDIYDYPKLREWKKERQETLKQAHDEYKGTGNKEEKERRIKEIELIFDREKPMPIEFDTVAQIATPNNFSGFEKIYHNFFKNKEHFPSLIKEIISYYQDEDYNGKEFDKQIKSLPFTKNITATQLYNPSQGQGVNKLKADGLNRKNFDSPWICETMKVSGALSDMICQLIKVGSKSYDLKVFVPEYKEVRYHFKSQLISDFKKYLKGNTPIKIDVLYILLLTQKIIEHSGYMGRRRKVKDIVSGLHSVYQKDLGQNKAVVNIGFIQVPNFIEISNKEENQIWIDILEEQRKIIGNLGKKSDGKTIEDGNIVLGLNLYRNFISGSDIFSFFDFSYWYATYLMSYLSKENTKKYARPFSVETLNKLYISMENELRLSEIITNDGFLAVATAIRKSTVSLQYAPKGARKYEIRYGVAQTLQNKSKSKDDLAEFIGEFIATYNAETAKKAEKDGRSFRPNVRENELAEFYLLLDRFPAKIIGALLASYGFALSAKIAGTQDEEDGIVNNDDENSEE